jgi:hypothetical protein
MADDIDLTQNNMELEEQIRKKYLNKPVLEAPAMGFCLNCRAELGEGKRWCDKDCQDDWSMRQK